MVDKEDFDSSFSKILCMYKKTCKHKAQMEIIADNVSNYITLNASDYE